MTRDQVSRRDFLARTAHAAAGVAAGAVAAQSAQADVYKNIFPQTVVGANERVLTGHIGTGGMGKRNLQFCILREDIQPIAVCDLLEQHRNQAVDIVTNKYPKPSTHVYFEEIIENKDVDAVVVVTPDHWHTIPSMMAADAKKDVWCEKPLSTTIGEGRALIEAVRRNNVVLQCGNFQRSGTHFQEVKDMVSGGYIGKVARVETWIHDGEKIGGIGSPPDGNPPEGLDWDRYLGWTPKVPFNPNRFLYNFRWFLEYSGGKVTDWGAHLMDIVLWAMGEEKKPKSVSTQGGKYILTDNRTTPDTLEVLYAFDDYVLSFSNRVYNGYVPHERHNRYGMLFYGTLGTLYADRMGYEVTPSKANGAGCAPKKVEGVKEMDMNQAHWQNFVDCVKSRKDPISFVESAHNTATVCHLGTTSYKVGSKLTWDAEQERFVGEPKNLVKKANKWAFRPYQNGWMLKPPYYKGWRQA
ncbi:MAG: Gfo/Idh/MocA family oxidoreductase [Candidatus Hydrogenedentes bacterium]|nr:Gfo/Idh/MocA family oxidoreductase [Candidatus Hydrogenedentota bacterium]